jgi:hypothetical protein
MEDNTIIDKKPIEKPIDRPKKKAPKNFVEKKHPNFSKENQPVKNGAPKGERPTTMLKRLLQEMINLELNGIKIKVTMMEGITRRTISNLLKKGDAREYARIVELIEGRTQNVNISGNLEVPIINVISKK